MAETPDTGAADAAVPWLAASSAAAENELLSGAGAEAAAPAPARIEAFDEASAEAPCFDPSAELKTLPNLPGCYRYFDSKGECLYVGKARDLKKRVSSYFRKTGLSPRIALMVRQIARLETTVTRSEAEALLLENNLIKTLHPRYNIRLRDDASYPYIRIGAEAFPRLSYYRGGVDKRSRFFGPYPNSGAARSAIATLQKAFGLRTCEEAVFKHRPRPCLLGQIGRCSAPCCGRITPADYLADCSRAADFLSGRARGVLDDLEKAMWRASDEWRYEDAARLRDRSAALTSLQHRQAVETTGGDVDADIVAAGISGGIACVNIAMVRGGRHLGDRPLFPRLGAKTEALMPTKGEILEAFASQHYAELPIPSVVIMEKDPETPDAAERHSEMLTEIAGRRVPVVTEPRDVRARWLEMCEANARIALERRLQEEGTQFARLKELIDILGFEPEDGDPMKFTVECFDFSHTAGEATQASCVVFAEGRLQSSL